MWSLLVRWTDSRNPNPTGMPHHGPFNLYRIILELEKSEFGKFEFLDDDKNKIRVYIVNLGKTGCVVAPELAEWLHPELKVYKKESQGFTIAAFEKFPRGWADNSTFIGQLDYDTIIWIANYVANQDSGMWDL
jgi:hypothetical protein